MKYWIYIVVLLAGCAQVSAPTGGAKDVEPPKIIASVPENFSLQFSGSQIELSFDEYVKFNQLNQNLMVSPALDSAPTIETNDKGVVIYFNKPLDPATTYTFNFGETVVDFNEGNKLDSNLFVFSTGDHLDSNQLTIHVKDAMSLKPVDGAKVMLYSATGDSLPYKEKPMYYGTSDATGMATISYLKEGDYKVFVLKEENANFLFDDETEAVGFVRETIHVAGKDSLEIAMFKEVPVNQYISKTNDKAYGKIVMNFNIPLSDLKIGDPIQGKWDHMEHELGDDSAVVWMDTPSDTVVFPISDGEFNDTITYTTAGKARPAMKIQGRLFSGDKQHYYKPLVIESSTWIRAADADRFKLKWSDDSLMLPLKFLKLREDRVYITYPFEAGTSYELVLDSLAITDFYNQTTDSFQMAFVATSENEYATADLKVSGLKEEAIVEVLSASGLVISRHKISNDEQIKLTDLMAGKHRLRMIFDTNGSGQWDTGDYLSGLQAEKVIYYSGDFTVRGGWDLDLTWKLE